MLSKITNNFFYFASTSIYSSHGNELNAVQLFLFSKLNFPTPNNSFYPIQIVMNISVDT
jgi:hypothetical protein